MSWKTLRRLCLPVAAALAAIVAQGTALAVPLVFDNGSNVAAGFTNPAGNSYGYANSADAGAGTPHSSNPAAAPVDSNFFSADIKLEDGSTLNVQASVHFDLHGSANLGISGATFSSPADIVINNPSVPLSSSVAHIEQTPTGGGTLTLWNSQTAGNDPGGDGSNPSGASLSYSSLSRADLTDFNATLISSPAGITSNAVTLTGGGQISNFLGLFDVPLSVSIVGNAKASVDSLTYTQTSGDQLSGNGTPGIFTVGKDATRNYGFDINNAVGNITGNATASLSASLSMTASILGIDFDIANNQSLGNLINQAFPINSAFPLPGQVTLADLNPTGYNKVNHDDLQFTAGINLTGLGVPFGLSSSGTALLITNTTITTNLVAPVTITVNVTGTVTFGIVASLGVDNIVYQLQDSVAGVVVPEPGSVVLVFIGLAAGLPLLLRRRRGSKR